MAAWGNSHLPHCHVCTRRCQAASLCVHNWPRAWQLRAAPIFIMVFSWAESICQGHRGFCSYRPVLMF